MTCLFIAALFLTPFSSAPVGGLAITFSSPATNAKSLFPGLGKAIGLTLETTPDTEGEVLLIRVKNVSAKDLMDRIASVANAEWEADGEAFRLVRPARLMRQAELRELDERAADINEQLKVERVQLKSAPAWSTTVAAKLAQREFSALLYRSNQPVRPGEFRSRGFADASGPSAPSTRAISGLMNDIGAARLAAIEPGMRVVYAIQPTSMQLPLGDNAKNIIAEFISRERQYVDAYNRASSNDPGDSTAGGPFNPTRRQGNPDLGLGQSLLAVARFGDGLRVTLTIADVNGSTVAEGDTYYPPPANSEPKLTGKDPIALSPLAKGFVAAMASIRGIATELPPMPSPGLSKELREWILRPESNDPQRLVPGEAFTLAANARGENLVADLPDPAFYSLTSAFARKTVGVGDLLNLVAPLAGLDVKQSDGWLTVGSRFPTQSVRRRVDRNALGVIARKLESQQYLRLDDLTRFTLSQAKPTDGRDIDGIWLRLINSTGGAAALHSLDHPWALRIYGTLTPTERSDVEAKKPISFSDMTPQQLSWLEDGVFNSLGGLMLRPPVDSAPGAVPFEIGGVLAERTVIFANGFPKDGRLIFSSSTERAVFGLETGSGSTQTMTAQNIASVRYFTQRPELAGAGPFQKFDLYRPASRTTYNLLFQFSPQVTLRDRLTDESIDFGTQPVAYEDLPDDFRTDVLTQLSTMKTRLAGIDFGIASSGVKPP